MIRADGTDLAFVTLKVIDEQGLVVPTAGNQIRFSIEGPGEIVATDNGNPYCMTAFPSKERAAFNGLALAIVKGKSGESGSITLRAEAEGLEATEIIIQTNTK